jgi:selT/selW/selH-like putative selenoprotein
LTEKILNRGKQRVHSLELVPFGDGRFEVYKNDKRVFSKLDSKNFPDEEVLLKKIL